MTSNQLIAMLLPVGILVVVGLHAWGLRWCVHRRRAARKDATPQLSAEIGDIFAMLDQAARLIQEAKRQLQRSLP